MNLKFPLRWKILVLTVVPLVILVVATLWIVNRNITRRVYANTGEDLQRASALFENMLASPRAWGADDQRSSASRPRPVASTESSRSCSASTK